MFAKRAKGAKRPAVQLNRLSSLVAHDVEIVGDLHFSGGVRIDGHLRGHAIARPAASESPTLLVLSDQGRIEGSVRCDDALINGTVDGDLDVGHYLELQSNARITGTVRYVHLKMDVGAAVQGAMVHAGGGAGTDNVVELPVEKTAG